MGKREREFVWRIYRLRKSPAEFLGRVHAPDEKTAIVKAIEEFKITDREQQKRLLAQRSEYGWA